MHYVLKLIATTEYSLLILIWKLILNSIHSCFLKIRLHFLLLDLLFQIAHLLLILYLLHIAMCNKLLIKPHQIKHNNSSMYDTDQHVSNKPLSLFHMRTYAYLHQLFCNELLHLSSCSIYTDLTFRFSIYYHL